jgi:hypothetical protein
MCCETFHLCIYSSSHSALSQFSSAQGKNVVYCHHHAMCARVPNISTSEDPGLLGYDAVSLSKWLPTFRITTNPSSSTLNNQRQTRWLETSGNTSPMTQLTVTDDLKPQMHRCENPQARTETSEPDDRCALSCYIKSLRLSPTSWDNQTYRNASW